MALQPAVGNDLERVYWFCAENRQGVTADELARAGWTDKEQLMLSLNLLLQQQRLVVKQLSGNKLLYQANDPQMVGLDEQHMHVLQLIEQAGNKGSWSKVLKKDSKLPQHVVDKITKNLLSRKLIKEVKRIDAKNKKVFMLWDVEPAQETFGGTWYHQGEFAASWVESLRQQCLQFLESNPGKAVTLEEVHDHVMQQPNQSKPTADDIAQVMRTLELDEELYSVQTATGQMHYTLRNRGLDIFSGRLPSFITHSQSEHPLVVPCLACHLQTECQPGGRICPEKCEYIASWLRGPTEDAKMNDW